MRIMFNVIFQNGLKHCYTFEFDLLALLRSAKRIVIWKCDPFGIQLVELLLEETPSLLLVSASRGQPHFASFIKRLHPDSAEMRSLTGIQAQHLMISLSYLPPFELNIHTLQYILHTDPRLVVPCGKIAVPTLSQVENIFICWYFD